MTPSASQCAWWMRRGSTLASWRTATGTSFPFTEMEYNRAGERCIPRLDVGDAYIRIEDVDVEGAEWCDGPPFAYHFGLEKAKAHLAALGAPEPALPPFDESKYEPMPEIEIRSEEHTSEL